MPPGRNDPCPCNSGRKYKHCCLAAASAEVLAPEVLLWRRMRRVLEGFPEQMLAFVLRTYGDEAVDEAWGEFTLWNAAYGSFDFASPYIPVFLPWMYHRWARDAGETDITDAALHGLTPTRTYLTRKGRSLDTLQRTYLEACLNAPMSFHEVLDCDPGQGMRLRDVFTGATHSVMESSASHSLDRGDVLYAQVVEVQGICMLEACSSVVIPPQRKIELIQLRRELQKGLGSESRAIDIEDREDILRECYLRMADEVLNPRPPMLQNTDGDPLALQRLQFDIVSPALTFERLKHLEVTQSESELRERAEHDASGALQRVRFTWSRHGNAVHAGWDNTILGHIEIDRQCLTLEVNSDRRADEGKRLIEQTLGDAARYRHTTALPIDDVGVTRIANNSALPTAFSAPDPMQAPETQAHMAAFMAQHIDTWPEQSLPALDGRTPLEAIRDADGREMVEALVQLFERNPAYSHDPTLIPHLRARLGLAGSAVDDARVSTRSAPV